MEHVENLLKTTLAEIERLLNTRTVVGDPITVEGKHDHSSGGCRLWVRRGRRHPAKSRRPTNAEGQGGGSGGGGGVKPVAVIIINKDGVRVEPVRRVAERAATVIEKMGEAVGRIIDKRGEKKA